MQSSYPQGPCHDRLDETHVVWHKTANTNLDQESSTQLGMWASLDEMCQSAGHINFYQL